MIKILSVTLHISGNIHHMIVFYGTLVWNDYISPGFFFLFPQNVDFLGCYWGKRAKNVPKWEKILSFVLHISGTIHHMIIICGTHVYNDNISSCFFQFFKVLIFQVIRRVKEQKIAQYDKKLCPLYLISQEPYTIWYLFKVHMCKRVISLGFFYIFSKF